MAFASEDARSLAAVLDEIIPPSDDGRMPGAGEAGLVSHVEAQVAKSPELEPVLLQGLAALREQAGGDFDALGADARRDALNAIAAGQPGFLPTLVFHTFTGYYQLPRVLEALGLEARPPHPKGHELEAGDLSLLDPVRERGKHYRDV
ncbi:MAG: gluconate 2-dehydrogenase subunit 3 family protein [Myxococcales bacterium]|nr:gluconate 2-dehydrogenase subunit 3 family protein [Myxococcales bacterium]